MSKFRVKNSTKPTISMSAMPDIVFLLLFFFMVTAVMRQSEEVTRQRPPQAKEYRVTSNKSLIKELIIGRPSDGKLGEGFRYVANGEFLSLDQIRPWLLKQRTSLSEWARPRMIIVLKADEDVDMGMIADLQQELREVNAVKLVYRTLEGP